METDFIEGIILPQRPYQINSQCFLEILEKLEQPDALFNEALWCNLIDHASVPGAQKKAIAFHLRNGDVKHVQLD